MVVRTLTFMIIRQVLSVIGPGPSPDAKDVEIAVLRHQLAVLHANSTGSGPVRARGAATLAELAAAVRSARAMAAGRAAGTCHRRAA
jgi:hypothetical protein